MGEPGILGLNRVEDLLSEQERALRDKVRDRGSLPVQLVPRMAELGLFGLHVGGHFHRPGSSPMGSRDPRTVIE